MFGHFNVVGKVYENEILLHDEVDTLAFITRKACNSARGYFRSVKIFSFLMKSTTMDV